MPSAQDSRHTHGIGLPSQGPESVERQCMPIDGLSIRHCRFSYAAPITCFIWRGVVCDLGWRVVWGGVVTRGLGWGRNGGVETDGGGSLFCCRIARREQFTPRDEFGAREGG